MFSHGYCRSSFAVRAPRNHEPGSIFGTMASANAVGEADSFPSVKKYRRGSCRLLPTDVLPNEFYRLHWPFVYGGEDRKLWPHRVPVARKRHRQRRCAGSTSYASDRASDRTSEDQPQRSFLATRPT